MNTGIMVFQGKCGCPKWQLLTPVAQPPTSNLQPTCNRLALISLPPQAVRVLWRSSSKHLGEGGCGMWGRASAETWMTIITRRGLTLLPPHTCSRPYLGGLRFCCPLAPLAPPPPDTRGTEVSDERTTSRTSTLPDGKQQ